MGTDLDTNTLILVPAPALVGWGSLSKLLPLSVPWFPRCQKGLILQAPPTCGINRGLRELAVNYLSFSQTLSQELCLHSFT